MTFKSCLEGTINLIFITMDIHLGMCVGDGRMLGRKHFYCASLSAPIR